MKLPLARSSFWLLSLQGAGVFAQSNENSTGFSVGPIRFGDDVVNAANESPLNKTSIPFLGFNFSADAGSTANASSTGNWTWTAGLSIINVDTNKTNYPIASAANASTNVLDVAYTLQFPEDRLPYKNETDWNLCAAIDRVSWAGDSSIKQRYLNDPGDCSVVLGASCRNAWLQALAGAQNSGPISACSTFPAFSSINECKSLSDSDTGFYSGSIVPWGNTTNPEAVHPGQIFAYETSDAFDAADAQNTYDTFSTDYRMMVMAFTPSEAFKANHSGTINPGEFRMFCTVMNKDQLKNAAHGLRPVSITIQLAIVGVLGFIWTMF